MDVERELALAEAETEGRRLPSKEQELQRELLTLEEEQRIKELEQRVHELMEQVHPSRRALARRRLVDVLGGFKAHEAEKFARLREKSAPFRAKVGHELKEFIEKERERKHEKEEKLKREEAKRRPKRGEMSGGLSGFGEALGKSRGF